MSLTNPVGSVPEWLSRLFFGEKTKKGHGPRIVLTARLSQSHVMPKRTLAA